ncbi:MAG: TonB-dependent receptor [Reichenbachiella sp.]
MKYSFIIAFLFGAINLFGQKNGHTINGYILDEENQEGLVGATVLDKYSGQGTITNAFGFFSLTLDQDSVYLNAQYIGYSTQTLLLALDKDKQITITLKTNTQKLKGVVVSADKFEVKEEVENTSMGSIRLKPKEMTYIPTIAGEVDIIKVAQLMPGVSRGVEGSTGMYVRGGTDDQNLVLLDDATVYNIGHLFGFFSIFNNESIRDVKLYKAGFPAEYGGRLSSVLDIRMKEGDMLNWHGSGGIGSISSRFAFNGPIVKEKLAIMVSGRRTYIDQVLKAVDTDLPYYFYDLNAKLSYVVNKKNKVILSSYFGYDILAFDEQIEEETAEEPENTDEPAEENEEPISNQLNFGFKLGNFTTTLRWNHIYKKERLFSNFTLFQTSFNYDISGDYIDNTLLIKSKIQDWGAKFDWSYFPIPKHNIQFGLHFVQHNFRPNVVSTSGDINDFLASQEGELIQNQELSTYFRNDHKVSERVSLNYGLRISSAIVPQDFYYGIEPRISSRIKIGENGSIKASYAYMKQYMHRVSSSSIVLPTDLWYPVTAQVKPQASHQISTGYYHGIESLSLNISGELYYKKMNNLIEYQEGARLILNDNFEDELVTGNGDSYGLELLLRKQSGRFIGWIGYSWAKATREFEALNRSLEYNAKYDRRHDLSVVGSIDITPKFTFSTTWVFSSGTKFTAQNGQFFMLNPTGTSIDLIPTYTSRNAVTLASTHRLDVNFIVKNDPDKKFRSEWHFSIYNFYNRASPYQVSVQFDGLSYRYVQTGIFGFIPAVTWNFKF